MNGMNRYSIILFLHYKNKMGLECLPKVRLLAWYLPLPVPRWRWTQRQAHLLRSMRHSSSYGECTFSCNNHEHNSNRASFPTLQSINPHRLPFYMVFILLTNLRIRSKLSSTSATTHVSVHHELLNNCYRSIPESTKGALWRSRWTSCTGGGGGKR